MRDIRWSMAKEASAFAMFDILFPEQAAEGEELFGDDLLTEWSSRDPVRSARFAKRNKAVMLPRNVQIETDHCSTAFSRNPFCSGVAGTVIYLT